MNSAQRFGRLKTLLLRRRGPPTSLGLVNEGEALSGIFNLQPSTEGRCRSLAVARDQTNPANGERNSGQQCRGVGHGWHQRRYRPPKRSEGGRVGKEWVSGCGWRW